MRSTAAVALAASLCALTACNSSYIPQARGRVAMIMQNGGPAYVRDGQIYRHGFLGNGLMKAVAGNPAAERAAREYHDRQQNGLLLSLGGLACSMIATVKMAADLDEQQQRPVPDGEQNNDVPTAALVAAGCLIASFVGAGYIVTAEPYRFDAINIFNDTTPSWTPGPPGQLGQLERARPSLRMRD